MNSSTKLVSLGLLILLSASCREMPKIKSDAEYLAIDINLEIPDVITDKSQLNYDNKSSLWTKNDEVYSGYSVIYYPDSTIKERIAFLNGRKQNQSLKRYKDGHLQQIAHYHKGKLHGEKKRWAADANHLLTYHLQYKMGKVHGEQKQWYNTGEVYKVMNLNMGKEEGMQQAYRKNGDLYANYEAKNGRIFGLKKASLCYGLESENLNYDD